MMQTARSAPLVIVLGATGTGKSRFAIDLCRKLGGEVLSTDAMQTYRGLDIATNKVSEEEESYCKHHLIGYLDTLELNSSVIDFRDKCLSLIADIVQRGRVPVIVGGTNYYIEAVLWQFTLNVDLSGSSETDETKRLSNAELHDRLLAVDRATAMRIHPNDRRKVLHAVQVYERCGIPISQLHSAQRTRTADDSASDSSPQRDTGAKSGPLRFPNCVAFRLRCDRAVMNERLDRRTNKMIQTGLIPELESFWKEHNVSQRLLKGEVDFTKGIFQSIGLRQFREYLELSDTDKQSDVGRAALERGAELMRTATRQYAKRQDSWIVNRFLKRPGQSVPPVYEVDVTHVEPPKRFDLDTDPSDAERRWSELVDRAVQIVKSYADPQVALSVESPVNTLSTSNTSARQVEFGLNRCETCDQVFVVKQVYEEHLRSKKHKRLMRAAAKRADRERLAKSAMNSNESNKTVELASADDCDSQASDCDRSISTTDDNVCIVDLYSADNTNREKHS